MDTYINREQTQAKHLILKGYLQELAFKVLHNWDLTYVDGFSGPWGSKTNDFSDTSFMIAISVLKDAQEKIYKQTGKRRKVKCFFSEKKVKTYEKLAPAVLPHNDPNNHFEIKTFNGKFVDAIPEIVPFIGNSFPLIFIDPTGWTEYPLDKIKPLFEIKKCEVLINFMYDHINRLGSSHPNKKIIESLNPILGGPNWEARLDKNLPKGLAIEKLFRETLKRVGNFEYVVSTKIDKSTQDRPHFFLVYGTKNIAGLKAFRQTEYNSSKEHKKHRSNAKSRKREDKTKTIDLFSDHEAELQKKTIDEILDEQKILASDHLVCLLKKRSPIPFSMVLGILLESYMLKEMNVKDICVGLATDGKIRNTWGKAPRKPQGSIPIELIV